jgi:hypothetical protein
MAAGVSPRPCRTSDPSEFGSCGARRFRQSPASRSSLARRTPVRPHQEHRVARRPRKQERALDPDDAVPRFSLSGPGGSRDGRSPSARVQRQTPTDLPMGRQQRLFGEFRRRTRANRPTPVCRLGHSSLTDGNCRRFCRPGNSDDLLVLDGGRCRDRTCDPSRVKGVPAICSVPLAFALV